MCVVKFLSVACCVVGCGLWVVVVVIELVCALDFEFPG